jgi:hypothetical protein
MSAKLFRGFLTSAVIAFLLTGCASPPQTARNADQSQNREYRRHAVRTVTTIGYPMFRPSGGDSH